MLRSGNLQLPGEVVQKYTPTIWIPMILGPMIQCDICECTRALPFLLLPSFCHFQRCPYYECNVRGYAVIPGVDIRVVMPLGLAISTE